MPLTAPPRGGAPSQASRLGRRASSSFVRLWCGFDSLWCGFTWGAVVWQRPRPLVPRPQTMQTREGAFSERNQTAGRCVAGAPRAGPNGDV